MAQSDATGWAEHAEGGQMRRLATFGETRNKRWPDVLTAKEPGYGVVSTSPCGIAAPKGMDRAVVKTLQDAFETAIDAPRHLERRAQLSQDLGYLNSDDNTQWARDTFGKQKALIARLGLGAKSPARALRPAPAAPAPPSA
jgi:tripartite-type tricarboxylate transporter receptor subunit TctC